MSDLPFGWGNRHNEMSKHDMKLGGAAATKFGGAKNAYENDVSGGNSATTGYKTSDQVREYYLSQFEKTGGRSSAGANGNSTEDGAKGKSNVPDFWEDRQKERDLQAKQMGVFSNKNTASKDDTTQQKSGTLSAEVALVQIATNTLETMARALEGRSNVAIPMEERAKFAKVMKAAMDAMAKQA